MDYKEQLLTQPWKLKRMEILERDKGHCQRCYSSKNLDVHHKYYLNGLNAWEYPNSALITLCRECHSKEHISNTIGEMQPIHRLELALERLVSVCKFPRHYGVNKKDDGEEIH